MLDRTCRAAEQVFRTDVLLRLERAFHQETPVAFLVWPFDFASGIDERISWSYSSDPVRRLSMMHMLAHEDKCIRDPLVDKLARLAEVPHWALESVLDLCREVHRYLQPDELYILQRMGHDSWQFLLAAWNADFCSMDLWDLLDTVDLRIVQERWCAVPPGGPPGGSP